MPIQIKSKPFITKIVSVLKKPGKNYVNYWKSDMSEIEIEDKRKFISDFRTNFNLLINKEIKVYSETSKAQNWDWLHLSNEQINTSKSNDWGPHNLQRLDKVDINSLPYKLCYLYKISVGSECYVGFTSKNPNDRLSEHLMNAKTNSTQKIHKELRKWGLNYQFEIIGEYENEVKALLDEIKFIKIYNAQLNNSLGGEGNEFRIIESKNEIDEYVFFVMKNFE